MSDFVIGNDEVPPERRIAPRPAPPPEAKPPFWKKWNWKRHWKALLAACVGLPAFVGGVPALYNYGTPIYALWPRMNTAESNIASLKESQAQEVANRKEAVSQDAAGWKAETAEMKAYRDARVQLRDKQIQDIITSQGEIKGDVKAQNEKIGVMYDLMKKMWDEQHPRH